MFSYIYADNRNLNNVIFANEKNEIERAALEYITMMMESIPIANIECQEIKKLKAALLNKDIKLAIKYWDQYMSYFVKSHVSCHMIEPVIIIE